MSDDSSSEDEITKRILKDSIDNDLLTNDLYKNGDKKLTEKTKCKLRSGCTKEVYFVYQCTYLCRVPKITINYILFHTNQQ